MKSFGRLYCEDILANTVCRIYMFPTLNHTIFEEKIINRFIKRAILQAFRVRSATNPEKPIVGFPRRFAINEMWTYSVFCLLTNQKQSNTPSNSSNHFYFNTHVITIKRKEKQKRNIKRRCTRRRRRRQRRWQRWKQTYKVGCSIHGSAHERKWRKQHRIEQV